MSYPQGPHGYGQQHQPGYGPPPQPQGPTVTCRRCRSPHLTANPKGFSGAKAFGGFLVAGPLGLLGGMHGSKDVLITCLACGFQWDPTVNAPVHASGNRMRWHHQFLLGAVLFGVLAYISKQNGAVGIILPIGVALFMALVVVGKTVPSALALKNTFADPITARFGFFAFWCLVIAGGGTWGRSLRDQPSTAPTTAPAQNAQGAVPAPAVPATPDDPEKHLLTDGEKDFLGSAGDYLEMVNKEDKKLVIVMAGAQTGDSTLDDIKTAIGTARANEGDYRVGAQSVPAPFAAVDKKIRRCKALHDSAFSAMFAGARDSNTAQVESGTANFERAVLLTNECIQDLRVAMQGVADKRRKAAKADAGKPQSPAPSASAAR